MPRNDSKKENGQIAKIELVSKDEPVPVSTGTVFFFVFSNM